jgi:hypothetical protein
VARERDYHAEYVSRSERAEERGYDSLYQERQTVRAVRDFLGDDLSYADASELGGVGEGHELEFYKDVWADVYGDFDYDDPPDEFWDWLDEVVYGD